AVHFGNGIAADHADLVGFGLEAGNDAGEVARLVNEVVEGGEVGFHRRQGRAHEEGNLGIVGGDGASPLFDTKGLTDHQRNALFGIFAHDALIVGIGDVLGIDVVDFATLFGSDERVVQAAGPLLLDRNGPDGGDLGDVLRPGGAGEAQSGS